MTHKKSLGQHFLTSQVIAKAIVTEGNVQGDDVILEIGPGRGILTRELLLFAGKVIAIEKDAEMIPFLEREFGNEIKHARLEIVEKDILDFIPSRSTLHVPISFRKSRILDPLKRIGTLRSDFLQEIENPRSAEADRGYKLIANIPYYITGKILRMFLGAKFQPHLMVLLVQKEVANRIVAKDGKESLLGMSVKAYGKPRIARIVKAGSFSPPPKVESAILKLTPNNLLTPETNRLNYYKLIKIIFKQPRKTLLNNLVDGLGISKLAALEKLKKIGLPGQERPQNLNLKNIEYLANDVF